MHPVYPRWRGEHKDRSPRTQKDYGLSPLARGTPTCRQKGHHRYRFIPAGAGNTPLRFFSPCHPAVYPRWRGEHVPIVSNGFCKTGLSPLARGTLQETLPHRRNNRFIPAGAGNTTLKSVYFETTPVYPRWRGEHMMSLTKRMRIRGLSPLARGTQHQAICGPHRGRFIPAGAGNTLRVHVAETPCSVYPRWRGEHALFRTPEAPVSGLSPLARGTL